VNRFSVVLLALALAMGCRREGTVSNPFILDSISLSYAVITYASSTGEMPTTSQGLMALVKRPTDLKLGSGERWIAVMKKVPQDPWGRDYIYRCGSEDESQWFEIRSFGRDGEESRDDLVRRVAFPSGEVLLERN
jgi:type II secretion system protein G